MTSNSRWLSSDPPTRCLMSNLLKEAVKRVLAKVAFATTSNPIAQSKRIKKNKPARPAQETVMPSTPSRACPEAKRGACRHAMGIRRYRRIRRAKPAATAPAPWTRAGGAPKPSSGPRRTAWTRRGCKESDRSSGTAFRRVKGRNYDRTPLR